MYTFNMEIRGILHCHSAYSYDAKLSLSELKALFQSRGLSFACMTEHTDELTPERAATFVAECDALSDSTFRFIPGFEVPYRRAHILMIGMRKFYEPYAATLDTLKRWSKEAAFVVLAHPVRNRFEVEPELLKQLDGLEVWNQQYEGKRVPRVRSLKLFETLRREKPLLVATGGLDLHRREHFGAPLTTMNVDKLDEQSIIEKLKNGAFTVSSHQAHFFGTLPDTPALIKKHRIQSHISVTIIVLGKWVNKILAMLHISLPKSLKERIRRSL